MPDDAIAILVQIKMVLRCPTTDRFILISLKQWLSALLVEGCEA
jgi:hypothetical protein